MRVVYFLPKFNFFSEGFRGRTSHAHGFISGLRQNRISVTLVSGPGYDTLYDATGIENLVYRPRLISSLNLLWVAYTSIRVISNRKVNQKDSVLVVRYATSVSYLISLFFSLFWKGKSIYEVNSTGYHQVKSESKFLLGAVLAIEKKLISAFDLALCVSKNISLDLHGSSIQCFVMPNGSSLPPVQLRDIERAGPRYVYLGGFQPYYDFRQLFRCFQEAYVAGSELHVYGNATMYAASYPEFVDCASIKFLGNYELGRLLSEQALSRRDIFVLPNGRNRMARIGSPTKLFEYLAFGSRILYQDYGQAGDILGALDSTFPYYDDASLTSALKLLGKQFNAEFRSPVSESEYNAIYTWEARVKTFQQAISDAR